MKKPNSRAGTVWPTSFTSLGPCRCLRRSTAVADGVSSLTAADTAAMRSELNFFDGSCDFRRKNCPGLPHSFPAFDTLLQSSWQINVMMRQLISRIGAASLSSLTG